MNQLRECAQRSSGQMRSFFLGHQGGKRVRVWGAVGGTRTRGEQRGGSLQPPPRPGSLPFPQPLGTQAEEALSLADDCRRVSVPLFTAPQKQAKEGELTPSPSPRGEWALGGRRSPLQRHSSPLLRPLCRPALGEPHLKRRQPGTPGLGGWMAAWKSMTKTSGPRSASLDSPRCPALP